MPVTKVCPENLPNLDAALKYAAMIPSAAYGTVEVRPLAVFG